MLLRLFTLVLRDRLSSRSFAASSAGKVEVRDDAAGF